MLIDGPRAAMGASRRCRRIAALVLSLAAALIGCGDGEDGAAPPEPNPAGGDSPGTPALRAFLAEQFVTEPWYPNVRRVEVAGSQAVLFADLSAYSDPRAV